MKLEDMPKKVTAKSDYRGCPWIKRNKVYEFTLVEKGAYQGCYTAVGELGSPFYTRLKHSVHIGGQDWEILSQE